VQRCVPLGPSGLPLGPGLRTICVRRRPLSLEGLGFSCPVIIRHIREWGHAMLYRRSRGVRRLRDGGRRQGHCRPVQVRGVQKPQVDHRSMLGDWCGWRACQGPSVPIAGVTLYRRSGSAWRLRDGGRRRGHRRPVQVGGAQKPWVDHRSALGNWCGWRACQGLGVTVAGIPISLRCVVYYRRLIPLFL
jgi:hypothetical protein